MALADLQLPPTNIRALKTMRVGDRTAINLAITASGLQELDLDEHRLSDFSVEFLEGMAPKPTSGRRMPRRSGLLGDAEKAHRADGSGVDGGRPPRCTACCCFMHPKNMCCRP